MKNFLKVICIFSLFWLSSSIISLKADAIEDIEIHQHIVDETGVVVLDDSLTFQEGDLIHLDITVENKSLEDVGELKIYSSLYEEIKDTGEEYISIIFNGVYKAGTNAQVDYSFDSESLIIDNVKSDEKLEIKLDIVINSIPKDMSSYTSIATITPEKLTAESSVCSNTTSCALKYFKLKSDQIGYYQGEDVKFSNIEKPDEVNSYSSYGISYSLKNTSNDMIENLLIEDGLIESINCQIRDLMVMVDETDITDQVKYHYNYGIIIPQVPAKQEIKISYTMDTKSIENTALETIISTRENLDECEVQNVCEKINIELKADSNYNDSKYVYVDSYIQNDNWNSELDINTISDNKVLNIEVTVKNMDTKKLNNVLLQNNFTELNGVMAELDDVRSNQEQVDYVLVNDGILIYNLDVQEVITFRYQVSIDIEAFEKETLKMMFKVNDDDSCFYKSHNCAQIQLENDTFTGMKLSSKLLIVLIILVLLEIIMLLVFFIKNGRK